MLLNKIVLSKTPPTSPNTVWAKPSNGGVSLYTYSNNKWGPILLMDDMGTDDPDDDLPGKVITLELFDETIQDLKDYVSENYVSNIKVLITTPPETLNAQVGYYYCIGGNGVVVDTMTIQLPAIADKNKTKNVQFFMTIGSAPKVTFVSAGTERILYQKDFALEAERSYEVNALWNGHAWVITVVEIIPMNIITYEATAKLAETTDQYSDGLHTNAFSGKNGQLTMTSHTFENGVGTIKFDGDVTSIGDSAFRSCKGLTSVTIPDSVTSIGDSAFRSCTGFTNIPIGNGVTSIGSWAFNLCSGLTNITIPDSVTSIGEYAFFNSGLTSVTIGNGVTSIGERAFYNCSNLTSCTIGNSIISIGEGAFSSCTSLTNIVVDSANTVFDSRDNCNAIIKTSTNELVVGCKSTVIPNTVTSIGDSVFYGCTSLTSITIPNTVTSIGDSVFYGCTGLTSITSLAVSAPTINDSTFENVKTGGTLTVPSDSTGYDTWMGTGDYYLGKYGWTKVPFFAKLTLNNGEVIELEGNGELTRAMVSDQYKDTLISAEIGELCTSIGDYAFIGCRSLTSITIPNSVTSIGDSAFASCRSLTSITIPNSVTSIGIEAFDTCVGLTSVTIGSGVTSIGDGTFYNCSGLTSVTIGSGVTSIGEAAFYGCSGLTSITSNAVTAPSIQSSTFRDVKTNGTLTVPNGSSGYNVWMGTGEYYLGKYNWTKVEQ